MFERYVSSVEILLCVLYLFFAFFLILIDIIMAIKKINIIQNPLNKNEKKFVEKTSSQWKMSSYSRMRLILY